LEETGRRELGTERARANEQRLHAALVQHASTLPIPTFAATNGNGPASALFQSFFIGGFECASHRTRAGRRLDLLNTTGHDAHTLQDYLALAHHGITTVRDGLRWHVIERIQGERDWSSFLPMLRAARDTGTQVIWDLAHYGWPDDLDIWDAAFPDRFAAFAGAVARMVRYETDAVPFYTPVNEISFWSWAAGEVGYFYPYDQDRGGELKDILVRSSIAAIEAIRSVDRRARIVHAEPAIHLVPKSDRAQDRQAATAYSLVQFEALDLLSGRLRPELGGNPRYVDILGINFYLHNEWVDGGLPISVDHPGYRPLHMLLDDFHARYGRPLFVAETGIEGDTRGPWLRIVGNEVTTARQRGTPVEGICLYPITDYPGWEDARPCPTGLLGFAEYDGTRPVFWPLAQELALQRRS
jgi:hypothetical protein